MAFKKNISCSWLWEFSVGKGEVVNYRCDVYVIVWNAIVLSDCWLCCNFMRILSVWRGSVFLFGQAVAKARIPGIFSSCVYSHSRNVVDVENIFSGLVQTLKHSIEFNSNTIAMQLLQSYKKTMQWYVDTILLVVGGYTIIKRYPFGHQIFVYLYH